MLSRPSTQPDVMQELWWTGGSFRSSVGWESGSFPSPSVSRDRTKVCVRHYNYPRKPNLGLDTVVYLIDQ